MKLVLGFDELFEYAKTCNEHIDISDYWEMTNYFLMNQFPDWDSDLVFSEKTFQVDSDNSEVSIELLTV